MLYTGFTEKELQEIKLILERNRVPFEINVHEESIDNANSQIKHEDYFRHKRGAIIDNSFFALSIDQGILKSLPETELNLLAELRIFPEMDFIHHHTEEEEPLPVPVHLRKVNKQELINRIFAILALLVFLFLGLDWIDTYVYPIFGGKKYIW